MSQSNQSTTVPRTWSDQARAIAESILRTDEVEELLLATKDEGERAGLIVRGLLHTGVRLEELCALNKGDLKDSRKGQRLEIRHGKGNKFRTVAIADPTTAALFEKWVVDGKGRRLPRDEPMFPGRGLRTLTVETRAGRRGKKYERPSCWSCYDMGRKPGEKVCPHITPRAVQRLLDRLSKATGIVRPSLHSSRGSEPGLWPHCFRHSFAVAALRADWNIRELQLQLGHASIVTTTIYLAISGDSIVETAKLKPVFQQAARGRRVADGEEGGS